VIFVNEKDLAFDNVQFQLSAGMYRALCIVIILNHLLEKITACTFAADDIGEGLDYERSSKLVGLILGRTNNSKIQVILTSNDRHLPNSVDVSHWNVLERKGGKVRSYNYSNSKEAFDEFMMTGLSTFDLLTGKMYKGVRSKSK